MSKIPIQIRAQESDRNIIDHAASILGKSRTDFILDSARSSAQDILLERRSFFLKEDDWNAVMSELDRPPSDKFLELLKETPPWEKS